MTNFLTILPHHKISTQNFEVKEESHVIKLEIKQNREFIPRFLSSIRSSNHEINVQTAFPISSETFTDLSRLSDKEREYEFLKNFSLRLVRHPGGFFRLHINPRLFGGGICGSKDSNTNIQPAPKPQRPTSLNKPEASSSSAISGNQSKNPIFFNYDIVPPEKSEIVFERVDQVRKTEDIAQYLKNTPSDKPEYLQFLKLATSVIEAYRGKNSKTKVHTLEISALAEAENPLITKELTIALTEEYEKSEFLEISILQALKTTLLFAPQDALDADDLVRILSITFKQFNKLHKQESTSDKLYATLVCVGELLDLMGDADVVDVKRVELQDAFYKELDTLSSHTELRISSSAAYALQSLVRVPNDESKLMSRIRRGIAAGKTIKNLYDVVAKKDPSLLFDAYTNFKEAYHSQDEKQPWHDEARMASALTYFGKWKTFEELIINKGKETKNPNMAGHIAALLKEALSQKQMPEVQTGCIHLLKDIVINEKKWGPYYSDKLKPVRDKIQDENEWRNLRLNDPDRMVKKGVIKYLVYFAGDPSSHIREESRNCLKEIQTAAKDDLLKDLIKELIPDIGAIPVRLPPVENKVELTELFTQANRAGFLTLAQKIQNLQSLALKNSDDLEDLATYVPTRGSSQIFSECVTDFDLQEKLRSFIESQKKIFLLIGESGSGKTLSLRALEQKLWTEWVPGKRIPLFISLVASRKPLESLIEEVLEDNGFNDEEIKELKKEHLFIFFLDGYDELNMLQNLYIKNGLQKWKAKVIVTCRKQFLAEMGQGYHPFFHSTQKEKKAQEDFEECLVRPFNQDQIKGFFQNYEKLNHNKIAQETAYETIIKIPGLLELLENPFLLRLSAEILPELKMRFGAENQNQIVRRIDLYDEFTKKWFYRSKLKLIDGGSSLNINGKPCIPEAEIIFNDFCRALSSEMLLSDLNAVEYVPQRSKYSSHIQVMSPWERFFGSEAKEIRNSIPIRALGSSTYAFLHKSLLEYFGANALVEDECNFKLGSRLLTSEHELLKFLAEHVHRNVSFQERLMNSILETRGKSDKASLIAAANSITILNKAGISFSRLDLSGIQVPKADLRGAIFYGANLRGANLSECLASQATFDFADLSQANLSGLDSGMLTSIVGHISPIKKIMFSQDRKILVSQSIDAVVAWDVEKKSKVNQWENINAFYFSPSNEELILKRDKHLVVWNFSSNKFVCALPYSQKTPPCFSSDGAYFLLPHADEFKVSQIETKTGKSLNIFDIKEKFSDITNWALLEKDRILHCGMKSYAIKMSAKRIKAVNEVNYCGLISLFQKGKEKLYGFCFNNKTIQIFKGYKDDPLLKLEHAERVIEWTFSCDESHALSKDSHNKVFVWELKTGKQIAAIENVTCTLDQHSFFANHKRLALAHGDCTIRIWDLETRRTIKTFFGSGSPSLKAVVSYDEKVLFSYEQSNAIKLWPLSLLEEVGDSSHYTAFATSLINSKGNLISLTETGQIQIRQQRSGNILYRLQTNIRLVAAVTESLDSSKIFIADRKRSLSIYSLASGQLELQVSIPYSIHSFFQLSNHDHLLFVSRFGEVLIWNWKTQVCEHTFFEQKTVLSSCCLSPDRKHLAISSFGNKLHVFDVETRELLYSENVEPISSMIISGSHLILARRETIEVKSLTKGILESTFKQKYSDITSLAYDDKSQRLAIGDSAGEIHIWIIENSTPVSSIKAHEKAIKILAWNDDGSLQSVGKDSLIACWDVQKKETLLWRSSFPFSAKNAVIEDLQCLDNSEKNLWIQQGAIEFSENTLLKKLEKEPLSFWGPQTDEFGNAPLHAIYNQYIPTFWQKLNDKNVKINPSSSLYKGLLRLIISSRNLQEKEKLNTLQMVLNLSVDLDQKDVFDYAFLYVSIEVGSLSCLSLLAEKGPDLNEASKHGLSLVVFASHKGHLRCLQFLYEKGAHFNVTNKYGMTPAMIASQNGHLECLQFLNEQGVDLNAANKDGLTCAIIASQNGHLECLQFLAEKGVDLNAANKDGLTPAMFATRFGYRECLQVLAERGVDLNAADKNEWTPAMVASMNGHLECLQFLTGQGVDLNVSTSYGATLTILTAKNGQLDCLQFLKRIGLDLNAANKDGWTPAMFASQNGHLECLQFLTEQGVDLNAVDNDGWTSAMLASGSGHLGCLRLLAEKGVDLNVVNNHDKTPAMIASQNGHLECLRFLTEKGVDLNAANKDGLTPIVLASRNDHLDCLQFLTEKGLDLNAADNDGWTSAMFASRSGHLESLRFLAEKEADLNAAGKNGWTPAMLASQNGHVDCLRLLIEKGVDLNAVSKDGWTSAMLASQNGHVDCLRLLIEKGTNLGVTYKGGWTLAMLASQNGHVECLRLFVEKGVDLNAANNDGCTPAMLASFQGFVECLQFLAEKGANLHAANKDGRTAAALASEKGRLNCLQFLAEKGANLNASDNTGMTPAIFASQFGHLNCLQFLAEQGVNLRAANKDGLTPIVFASKNDHNNCVQFLLDKYTEASFRRSPIRKSLKRV